MRVKTSTKFIVVSGGVMSGVGKGVATASIGKIMKEHGYKTTLIKIDPYINCDAGTLRPTEHGEVWVTHDGGEIDQDLGTYERFMDVDISKQNNITTGQIYNSVILRERAGEYLGQTVQFIPHITDEIVNRVLDASQGYDIAIIEIGGTVGDYENAPFLFALKGIERELGSHAVAYVLVTYLPVPGHIGEMKTKPTQQAIRMMGEQGIMPDFIICRSRQSMDSVRQKKIELFAHIPADAVLTAPDIDSIYRMPLVLEEQGLGEKVLTHLRLPSRKNPDWRQWQKLVHTIVEASSSVKIAIVGKYLDTGSFSLTDSYLSICHALVHAAAHEQSKLDIEWLDAKLFEADPHKLTELAQYDGIVIPGGFGTEGTEGKIKVIAYARMHDIPLLGLCYGMQLAAIEFARNVCGLIGANTTEVDPKTPYPIIDILPLQKQILQSNRYGGTMRLGSYKATLKKDSIVYNLYKQADQLDDEGAVTERHRHRYEMNPAFVKQLESSGFIFGGYHQRKDATRLMEFAELKNHPFFVVTQAHPEFKSRLSSPHPLFNGFMHACKKQVKQAVNIQAKIDEPRYEPAHKNDRLEL